MRVKGYPNMCRAAAIKACAGATVRAAILGGIAAGLDHPDLVDVLNGEYGESRIGMKPGVRSGTLRI